MTPDPTTLRPCPRCRAETEHVEKLIRPRAAFRHLPQPKAYRALVCLDCGREGELVKEETRP